VLLGGAILYLVTLDLHGFWYDEVQTARGVRLPFLEMVESRLSHGHPPLFFAIEWVVLRLWGEHEVSLRLIPALLGLLSVAFVHLIGRRLLGAWPGLVAACLLLFSPLQIGISQQARAYTLVQALLLGATLLLVRTEADSWRDGLRFSLLTTLAGWTHFSAFLVIGAQILGLAIARRWRAAVSGLVAFALAVPVLMAVLQLTRVRARISWISRGEADPWSHVFIRPFADLGSSWLADPLNLSLAIALLTLGLLGVWMLSGHRVLVLAIWIGPPLFVGVAELWGAYPVYRIARYFAASWAVAPLLVVGGIWRIGRAWRAGAVALLLAVSALALTETVVDLRDGTNWSARDVAAIIQAEGKSSDVLLLHTDRKADLVALAHYAKMRVADLSQRRGWPKVRRRKRGADRAEAVWIVFRLPEPTEGRAFERLQALSERFPQREEWQPRGDKLVRLSRSTPDSGQNEKR
jgi:4-amino-4-deoxy-L-arabinose transferase-like glycosyltransferase